MAPWMCETSFQCLIYLWWCVLTDHIVVLPRRHPSQHFCGTPTHHPDHPDALHKQPLLYNQDTTHQQHFEKAKPDRGRGLTDEARPSSGRERERLKRQSSPVTKDSCPMHLVATHSFVEIYGVEDAIQFMVISGSPLLDDSYYHCLVFISADTSD